MEVIVERSPKNTLHSFMFMFYYLIDVLNTCKSYKDIRIVADNEVMKAHFDMGFGKHHFWASEKNNGERLVIVKF